MYIQLNYVYILYVCMYVCMYVCVYVCIIDEVRLHKLVSATGATQLQQSCNSMQQLQRTFVQALYEHLIASEVRLHKLVSATAATELQQHASAATHLRARSCTSLHSCCSWCMLCCTSVAPAATACNSCNRPAGACSVARLLQLCCTSVAALLHLVLLNLKV
jgi:hypothetical protein